jgi:hypothetical protein
VKASILSEDMVYWPHWKFTKVSARRFFIHRSGIEC